METKSLKKRREIIKDIFSSKEWEEQDKCRKDCIPNFKLYRDTKSLCKADCGKCKIQDYMPLGLESLLKGGFLGIAKKQQGEKK
jgi:hypothetical protein